MEDMNWELHDTINEIYEAQRQSVWTPEHLIALVYKSLGTLNKYIMDIDISEDIHSHHTCINIVINERKYLVEKLINPSLQLEDMIMKNMKYMYPTLNPVIKIKIE